MTFKKYFFCPVQSWLLLAIFLSVEGSLFSAAPASTAESSAAQDEFGAFENEFGKADEAASRQVYDPLERYNRFMFKVNDKFYFWLVKPAAKGYNKVMPKFARKSFGRAFHNLAFPLRFVSSLFQLKFKKAGTELGRFLVNSTLGVGGLWDPADRYLKWYPSDEDLGQMLAFYGVKDGAPIVLPILGQTNLRDGVGTIGAIWLNPVIYVADTPTSVEVRAGENFNVASLHLGEYESIKKDALDPYTFIRDAYKQNRDKKIKE